METLSQQYALSLYELVKDSDKDNLSANIDAFVNVIAENEDLDKIKEIEKEFSKIWDKKNEDLEVSVFSAHKISDKSREIIIKYLQEKTNYKNILINENIDQDVLGGVRIRYNDKKIDGSLVNSLNNLKRNINK